MIMSYLNWHSCLCLKFKIPHAGTMSMAEIETTYRIGRRIEAEERALDAASVVFTSTQQEVAEQWGTYDGWVCYVYV